MSTLSASSDDQHQAEIVRNGFNSPDITRKQMDREYITTRCAKKSRRARSSEPTHMTEDTNDELVPEISNEIDVNEAENDKLLSATKVQETMSKSELISCYRLLMGEKLRLERFLSIVTKNNEMARNRLESDLLDAMMCIEDLKQALELRMARRSKIDPREAEERRYLIRQNKKLLNQLYESAKKIEKLELTKVEMKEQLELLDFQILEVENQKAMMEEELRKLPPTVYAAVQTEDHSDVDSQQLAQLHQQLDAIKSELCHQKAETAAALAKQQHLDNLVRELRRDNVELRDQLAKIDDAENSLAESDKPLARDTRMLQTQLDTQVELIRELQAKLKVSRDYTDELESQLRTMEPKITNGTLDNSNQAAAAQANGDNSAFRTPRVDDLLLQETIRTFHALIAERDQELSQLKTYIRHNQPLQQTDEADSIILPDLFDSTAQTDLKGNDCDELFTLLGVPTLSAGDRQKISSEIKQIVETVAQLEEDDAKEIGAEDSNDKNVTFSRIMTALQRVHQQVKLQGSTGRAVSPADLDSAHDSPITRMNGDASTTGGTDTNVSRLNGLENQDKRLNDYEALRLSVLGERPSSAPTASSLEANQYRTSRAPHHFSHQLQQLKELGELETVHAQLGVAKRRNQDLERRVAELTEELARVRSEGRATEASLSAARRTEAALRRRLLVAMDAQGSTSSSRHSVGATIDGLRSIQNPVDAEAALLRSEAINASLTEAAQLDRTRLQEQTLHIAQLEAERRTLHDRIASIQASEAGAQRGIVRLQALYEDMLREYSESRNHEITLRQRERSRSNYRNKDNSNKKTRSQGTLNLLQERITSLESENMHLKRAVQSSEQQNLQVSKQCSTPSCNMVRQLLQAFQERFSELITQLYETQSCLNKHGIPLPVNGHSEKSVRPGHHKCISLIQSVHEQLNNLISQSKPSEQLVEARATLMSCVRTLEYLQDWMQCYFDRTDAEVSQLRQILLGVQICNGDDVQTLETACTDANAKQPFSCSIRINKKPNWNLLSQKDREILDLRKQVRELETDIQTGNMKRVN